MHNFSEILSTFETIDEVIGVAITDTDGLTLASSFPTSFFNDSIAPFACRFLNDLHRNFKEIGEEPKSSIVVMSDKVILIQAVVDLVLIVYAKKSQLHAVQNAFEESAQRLYDIATFEFSNI